MSITDEILQTELPAKPLMLSRLSVEMQKDDPDFMRVSELISADVGLASAVVKIANSPYVGLGRRIASVQQAVSYLGLAEVFGVVTGLLLRRSFKGGGAQMERLWDLAARRAGSMAWLARQLRSINSDRAYTCGLFEDCGMAVLLMRASGYAQTLAQIEHMSNPCDTEREKHGLDHVVVGQGLMQAWGLPDVIVAAVGCHHDIGKLESLPISAEARMLVALSAFANEALRHQEASGQSHWPAHVSVVARVLETSEQHIESWLEELPALAAAA
ncbi:MAG: HDOD domain-containing protein [Burkholderiales bacterium]|nr:HDOD domain-containing protein [Burkholderiales bacterium]